MTTTISPPIRILAVVGVLAAVGLGLLMFAHNRSSSSSGSSATPAPSATNTPSQPGAKPATTPAVKPAVKPAAKPHVRLLPYLPSPIATSLRSSKVVVVALFSRGVAGDMETVAQAKAAAKSAHAGFAAVNVLDERSARRVGKFAGLTVAPPVILIVRRPGKIVNQLGGTADSGLVAQAAMDAGAGR